MIEGRADASLLSMMSRCLLRLLTLTFLVTSAAARAFYAKADVTYLEGSLDSGKARGKAYKFLEKNCSAEVQGPYRLQRGIFYAAYDKARLAHGTHRLIIVPGCAHKVTCVFESPAARAALLSG
jgi:hypothetical protein